MEFASYGLVDGVVATTRFATRTCDIVSIQLTLAEADRKREALARFASQRDIVRRFTLDREEFRPSQIADPSRPRASSTLVFARSAPEREERWRMATLQSLRDRC